MARPKLEIKFDRNGGKKTNKQTKKPQSIHTKNSLSDLKCIFVVPNAIDDGHSTEIPDLVVVEPENLHSTMSGIMSFCLETVCEIRCLLI